MYKEVFCNEKQGKKLVGLLMGTVMLIGGTMNVCAATPKAVANWSVSSYPGTSSSSSYYMLDNNAGTYCAITCSNYSSGNVSAIKISSSNFTSGVSIGGYGNVSARKRTIGRGNTYYVKASCDGSSRTIASGMIQG